MRWCHPSPLHPPRKEPRVIKPPKPSKANRNNRKQELRKVLADQQRQRLNLQPRRLEDVVSKRMG